MTLASPNSLVYAPRRKAEDIQYRMYLAFRLSSILVRSVRDQYVHSLPVEMKIVRLPSENHYYIIPGLLRRSDHFSILSILILGRDHRRCFQSRVTMSLHTY